MSPLPAVAPRVRADRVVYLRGDGVREWYAAGQLGVEQGFALARRPAGRSGAVSLELTIAGLRARLRGSGVEFLARSGQVALRYGGMVALDARGRRLPAWLSLSGSRLALQVADGGARYPLRIDPLVQQAELMPDGALHFGWSVAADGNTIVVGAPGTMVGSHGLQGAVYVFVGSGGVWKEQQELTARDGATSDQLGNSVAISGDTVVAGAWGVRRGENSYQGATYVFAPAAVRLGSTAPAGPPKLRLVVTGPRTVTAGRIARYRIILSVTQTRNRRASPVRNVQVRSTHAGRPVGRWLFPTLPLGRSRALHLKVTVPSGARGRFCITTDATAKRARGASLRYCAPIAT